MDKIFLIARREYLAYVTAWGFWLGLLFTPIILGLSVGLPMLIEKTQPVRYYTVIDPVGDFSAALQTQLSKQRDWAAEDALPAAALAGGQSGSAAELISQFRSLRDEGLSTDAALADLIPDGRYALPPQSFVMVAPPAETIEELTPYLLGGQPVSGALGERPLYAAFIVFSDRIEYWSTDVVSSELLSTGQSVSEAMARRKAFIDAGIDEAQIAEAVRRARPVEPRSPAVADESGKISFADKAPFFVALALSFLLWLLIFSVVNYLLTGTIEERSNKIFDTLLTSVSLSQMLTGKLLGVLGLSLTLISVWGGVSLTFSMFASNHIPPEITEGLANVLSAELLLPTLISFVLGYLMYGALFLALGSLCDSIQEAQALLSPVFIVMMVPLLMIPVAINSPDSPLLGALSWVPLLTPFLLILRIPNDLPLWEILAQIGWMGGFAMLVLWGGSRVYRAGAVHGMGIADVRRVFSRMFGKARSDQN